VRFARLQRDDTGKASSEKDKYADAGKKIGEAFLETDVGKGLKDKATKLGKNFIATLPGQIIAGTAAAGAVTAIVAKNKELPVGIPEVPLDALAPGLKMRITYEGPVRSPTKAAISFTYTFGGAEDAGKKKPAMTESEKYRAETARLQAEQEQFQEGLKTPAERKADDEFWKSYWRMKSLDPLNPLQIPGMKPKEGASLLMRKAEDGPDSVTLAPPIVEEALASGGKPLDPGVRAALEPQFGHDFSQVRVHTDAAAGESARAVNARAYTVQRDMVFAPGEYAPQTQGGQWLLAHELAHVVQQGGGGADRAALAVEPAHSPAEREADTAADASVGAAAGPVRVAAKAGGGATLRRSILGDIAGTLLGAAGGAALGFLVGGPIGAIVGGVLGGVAGLAIGDALSANKRPLTSDERTEAKLVFGDSLDMNAVKLAEAPIMALGQMARTPFDTVYFPPGTFKESFSDFMPWLIHELTHVWQYQHGVSVLEKLWVALHGKKAYNYGGEEALRRASATGKRFTDFNTEQQGDILRDYYLKMKAGKDTSAYDPFVAQVKGGARQMGDFPAGRERPTAFA
jgi:hypothetical protein